MFPDQSNNLRRLNNHLRILFPNENMFDVFNERNKVKSSNKRLLL